MPNISTFTKIANSIKLIFYRVLCDSIKHLISCNSFRFLFFNRDLHSSYNANICFSISELTKVGQSNVFGIALSN